MNELKPILVIARSKREADAYAYTSGIVKYIFIKNAESLMGIERGLHYVYVPEYLYMISNKDFGLIEKMLIMHEHKPVC